jgi:hypothetical protein
MSVVLLGSTSGSITLQEPAVAGTNTVNFGANTGVAILDANTPAFRNRIINGAMVIDQRNAGASVTNTTGTLFPVDRFSIVGSQASKFTAQQSTTAPTGHINSLLCTSSSAYTVGASEDFTIRQSVEGLNITDLGWGTANAQTVTLSFWVRSSLTGTFGGSISNSASDRFYPFSFTINSANTFEQKSITIAGDTSGTWLTTNGIGLRIIWSLGAGATVSGTAGAWTASYFRSVTGAVSVVGTNGATFYITGVQLEKGSTATSFDYRSYGTELALCQRYYEKHSSATGNNFTGFAMTTATSSTAAEGYVQYLVSKRTSPTISGASLALGDGAGGGGAVTSVAAGYRGAESALVQVNVASGLTQFRPYNLLANNSATAYIDFSAEL